MPDRTTRADLYRYGELAGIKGFLKGFMIPGFRYTYVFRKSEHYKANSLLYLFFKLLKRRYRFRYGFEISSGAVIGEGLHLSSHSGHIIIGPVKIGRNCNINHSVTIGRSYKGGKIGRPTIDDYVWIGTGAVIVGKINIGKNVLIAPNSFVNFDIPDNSLVIGNPAKIFQKVNPTRNYINYVLPEE
jgi:serine O-acetyltransferase